MHPREQLSHIGRVRTQGLISYAIQTFTATKILSSGESKWGTSVQLHKDFLWIQDTPLLEGIILKRITFWVDNVYNGAYYEEIGEKKKKAKCFACLVFLKLTHLKNQSVHIAVGPQDSGVFMFCNQYLRHEFCCIWKLYKVLKSVENILLSGNVFLKKVMGNCLLK